MDRLGISFYFTFLLFIPHNRDQRALPISAAWESSEAGTICNPEALPRNIQDQVKKEFSRWKIQEPPDLSFTARERWNSERPLQCPGLASGLFESEKARSYALLLVPPESSDAGYRLIVFTPTAGKAGYYPSTLEESKSGVASNFFIRAVPLAKFFDQRSRQRFKAQEREGIMMVDAGETEYETDVYFWSKGSYHHQPIDY